MNKKTFRRALLALPLALAAAVATAQSYPSKTITLIVPFPAGGVTDVVGRAVASRLSVELGQTVVVDNKPGASGMLGSAIAAKAAPDGYTLLLGNTSTLGTNPASYEKLSYDPLGDFAPISLLALQPLVVAVHPSVPAQNLKELIALAKANPGSLSYGSAGSSIHLAVELFNEMYGVKMLHVPYKGSAPAIADLIGGQVQVLFDPISTVYPHVRSGKARGLAVTTRQASTMAMELPTVVGATGQEYDVSSWQALVVPKGTPAPVVQRLHEATVKVLKMPETRELFARYGATPAPTSAEDAGKHIRSEVVRWKAVARQADIKPE